ncbi:MAG: 50S ribosomal protein L21 [bacterium]
MVYAVIESGGRQLRVTEGGVVRVERLDGAPGDEVTLDRVLLIGGEGTPQVGTPSLSGALVRARVLRQGRGRKIRVMKYKAKAHYRRRSGHRQAFTELRIERIELGGRDPGPSEEAAPAGEAVPMARARRKKTGGA